MPSATGRTSARRHLEPGQAGPTSVEPTDAGAGRPVCSSAGATQPQEVPDPQADELHRLGHRELADLHVHSKPTELARLNLLVAKLVSLLK